eukprot:gene32771-33833_t
MIDDHDPKSNSKRILLTCKDQYVDINSNNIPEKFRFSLVVEDDTLFTRTFARFTRALHRRRLRTPMSCSSAYHPPKRRTSASHSTGHALRTPPACDAYLVTPKAAEAMARAMLPVRLPTPIHLHYGRHTWGYACTSPSHNVFVTGQRLGPAVSTIQSNNLLNMEPAILQAIRRTQKLRGKPEALNTAINELSCLI